MFEDEGTKSRAAAQIASLLFQPGIAVSAVDQVRFCPSSLNRVMPSQPVGGHIVRYRGDAHSLSVFTTHAARAGTMLPRSTAESPAAMRHVFLTRYTHMVNLVERADEK